VVAGTDGSADRNSNRMGAGYAIGIESDPEVKLSFRVGGRISSFRAEAASAAGASTTGQTFIDNY